MNGLYDVSSGMSVEEGVMKLFKRRFRLDVRKFVFSNRVVDHWNVLSQYSINCNSINTFKKYVAHDWTGKCKDIVLFI